MKKHFLSILLISVALLLTACGKVMNAEIESIDEPKHKEVLAVILEPYKNQDVRLITEGLFANQKYNVAHSKTQDLIIYQWEDLNLVIYLKPNSNEIESFKFFEK